MDQVIDPVWLAAQLTIAPRDLVLIPLGTALVLWLLTRMSVEAPDSVLRRRIQVWVVVPRFAFGFIGGLVLAMIAFGIWAEAAPSLTGKPSQFGGAFSLPAWFHR